MLDFLDWSRPLRPRVWQLARYIRSDDPKCPMGRLYWLISRPPRRGFYRSSYCLNGPRFGYYGLVEVGRVELLPMFVRCADPNELPMPMAEQ